MIDGSSDLEATWLVDIGVGDDEVMDAGIADRGVVVLVVLDIIEASHEQTRRAEDCT